MNTVAQESKNSGWSWAVWCWFLDRLYVTRVLLVVVLVGLVAVMVAEPEIFDAGAPIVVLSCLVWKADRHLWLKKKTRKIPAGVHWIGTLILLAGATVSFRYFVQVAHMGHTGHWGCPFGKVISGYPHQPRRLLTVVLAGGS